MRSLLTIIFYSWVKNIITFNHIKIKSIEMKKLR